MYKSSRRKDAVTVGVLIVTALAVYGCSFTGAKAHDVYHGIKRPDGSGISCCGDRAKGGDCRPAEPVTKNGQTLIDGVLWDKSKIVPSPDEKFHVCEKQGTVFCILVPSGV